ncbi:mechanosensitive ion channel protein MscL [Caulobacter sp. Root1455]|uniref:large-conductance mechanosensitive channel protein MscL n=1 Tax=Caulobacter sp. Root1455 TaxID=1736465 RepID=UPI0006FD84FE|nr:large-conductance mechanosensitive channel protein MscL [Caulobacter sp. Root1455]KQZ02852.1 mechanosensitive ion channel protein MscL [Caulobacter sp. Root1455]
MSIIQEFREFIARGNVIDLAVGVIIGAAFNSIVKSLVDQVVMPPIGLAMGGLDFSKMEWVLKPEDPATTAVEKVAVQYGAFINTVIQFLIVAVVVFLLVKLVNQLRRAEAAEPAPEAPAAPTPEERLLTEIRDLLARPAASAKVPARPKPKA